MPLLLCSFLALAGCGNPAEENFGLVTLEGGESVGFSLRELPKETLSKIYSVEEFSSAIARPNDGRVRLLVRRGKTDLYVPMDMNHRRHPELVPPRRATDILLRT